MIPLARLVSIVGHPFATMLAFALALGALRGAAREATIVAAGISVPIALLVVRQRRAGRWSTVDASDRRDRPLLYAVALVAAAAVMGVLLARRDFLAARAVAGVVVLLGAAAVANRWVKASLHVGFATFAGAALLALRSPAGWALALLVPPLAWSRLRLRRHAAAEVAAGAALGIAAALVLVA